MPVTYLITLKRRRLDVRYCRLGWLGSRCITAETNFGEYDGAVIGILRQAMKFLEIQEGINRITSKLNIAKREFVLMMFLKIKVYCCL